MPKAKSQRRRAGRRSALTVTKVPRTLSSLADHVTGQIDPFAPNAKGMKLYDSNSSASFTLESRAIYNLPVNNQGCGYAEVSPFLASEWITLLGVTADINAAATTGAVITTGTGNSAAYTALASQVARYRVVSYGIRVYCTQAPLNRQGRVLIRELPSSQMLINTSEISMAEENYFGSLADGLDIQVTPGAVGDQQYDYIPLTMDYATSLANVADTPPFKLIGITLYGCATSGNNNAIVTVEVVKQLEILPEVTSILRFGVTDAAPHSNQMMESINNTRGAIPLAHNTKTWRSKLRQFAASSLSALGEAGMRAAGLALSRYLGGPATLLQLTNGRTPMEVD